MKKTFFLVVVFIALYLSLFQKTDEAKYAKDSLKKGAVVLAFGDSLTYGYGVSKEYSYPSQFAKKTGLHVINAGRSGEESSDGLSRLPTLLEQNPDLVILCHGGNDILRRHSREKLKNNLLSMISLIKTSGAKVLLVGVPDFGLFGFDVVPLYEEVADETGVIFEDEILSHVESKSTLKSDKIHPNEKGYEMMADAFIDVLREYKVIN